MKHFRLIMLILASLAIIPAANAGPFGSEKGGKKEDFSIIKELKPFTYQVSVKKPHASFETYIATIHPTTGLCLIKGVGKTNLNDSTGLSTRKVFNDLRAQLDSVYGNSSLFDWLRPGALWKETHEWMMAVTKGERSYEASWDADSKSTLKDGISEILLTVNGLGTESGYVTLQYRFDNWDQCKAAMNKSQSDSL